MDDIRTYCVDHVRAQAETARLVTGAFELEFYTSNGRPSRTPTEQLATFYYYPSGGTIRDADLNIVFYEPKLDRYHPANRARESTSQ